MNAKSTPLVLDVVETPNGGSLQRAGSAKCPVCEMGIEDDNALFIHVYLEHPEVHDNIDKMLKGEPYESAETLRSKGILPNAALSGVEGKP